MNIACPTKNISAPITHKGLDNLMARYRRSGAEGFGSDFLDQLESAALQLEYDPKWNARLTDLMATALTDAVVEYTESGYAGDALERLSFLYIHGVIAQDLETTWQERMNSLAVETLQTTLTRDLERALSAASQGRHELVNRWILATEDKFFASVERYESLAITQGEVTTESVLSHRLLMEGLELWLEALALFQETLDSADLEQIRELALAGQRRLRFVQSLKEQRTQLERRFFVHYN